MPLSIRRFHPARDDDRIGARRVRVAVHRDATGGRADFHDVHLAHDRRAEAILGYSQRGEHLALAGARSSAVGAHRRDEERLPADVANGLREPAQERRNVRDATAAGGDRNPRSRGDPAAQHMRQRVVRGVLRIGDRRCDECVADDACLNDVHRENLRKARTLGSRVGGATGQGVVFRLRNP
jgi:hypothetical protein